MTGAQNTELGCRQGQRHWRLSLARRELRQWQSAVAEAGRLGASLGEAEYEVAKWIAPPDLNRLVCGSRRVSHSIFRYF